VNDVPGLEGRHANRAWWDEAAPLHATSELYDLDGFRAGRDDMRAFELEELGPVAGLELLHLQCHIGSDTLSWARHGARVVGLDFSSASLDVARELAAHCGIDAEFVCADVYDALDALGGRTFDVVYTGIGALGWLPDVARWAEIVHALLRPGGVLYLVEIHPIVFGVIEDGHTLSRDIIDAEYRAWDEPGGTYAAPDALLEHTVTYERDHALGDVLSAVLDAGLVLELFHEQSVTNVPWPWAVRDDDGTYRVPDDGPRFPLTYSLRARRPGTG
jgi:2-polyprenyl-3-methyl-5-hydroxy-6-metoxy-1,4-benzoquinol methylase